MSGPSFINSAVDALRLWLNFGVATPPPPSPSTAAAAAAVTPASITPLAVVVDPDPSPTPPIEKTNEQSLTDFKTALEHTGIPLSVIHYIMSCGFRGDMVQAFIYANIDYQFLFSGYSCSHLASVFCAEVGVLNQWMEYFKDSSADLSTFPSSSLLVLLAVGGWKGSPQQDRLIRALMTQLSQAPDVTTVKTKQKQNVLLDRFSFELLCGHLDCRRLSDAEKTMLLKRVSIVDLLTTQFITLVADLWKVKKEEVLQRIGTVLQTLPPGCLRVTLDAEGYSKSLNDEGWERHSIHDQIYTNLGIVCRYVPGVVDLVQKELQGGIEQRIKIFNDQLTASAPTTSPRLYGM